MWTNFILFGKLVLQNHGTEDHLSQEDFTKMKLMVILSSDLSFADCEGWLHVIMKDMRKAASHR